MGSISDEFVVMVDIMLPGGWLHEQGAACGSDFQRTCLVVCNAFGSEQATLDEPAGIMRANGHDPLRSSGAGREDFPLPCGNPLAARGACWRFLHGELELFRGVHRF